jgi:hypothetical protein
MYALIDTRKNIVVQTEETPFDVHPDFQWIETNETNIRYGTKYVDGSFVNEFTDAFEQLRTQRNDLLIRSDWRMTTDYPYADQAEWASYRTSLRNLPATAEPTLDENGQLTNVVWPTPPDAV